MTKYRAINPAFAGATRLAFTGEKRWEALLHDPKPLAVQTVYMPVYPPPPTGAPAPSSPLPSGQPPPSSAPVEAPEAAQRSASLLERRRGVLSTVLTGFRGLFSQTVTLQRKSLLGE